MKLKKVFVFFSIVVLLLVNLRIDIFAHDDIVLEENMHNRSSIKILSIGNSFSVDCQRYLYPLLKNMGVKKVKLGNLYISGASLDRHHTNLVKDIKEYTYYTNTSGKWKTKEHVSIKKVLMSEDWDYITLQQSSSKAGIDETYDSLDELLLLIKFLAPNAKIVWNSIWAYQQNTTHKQFENYLWSQNVMFQSINRVMVNRIFPNEDIDLIIPTGTAIQNARVSSLGDSLTRDGYHLSKGVGCYIASLSFALSLFPVPIDSITYIPKNVEAFEKEIAIEAVKNALEYPLSVSSTSYQLPNVKQLYSLPVDLYKEVYYTSNRFSNKSYKMLMNDNLNKRVFSTPIFNKKNLPVGSIVIFGDGVVHKTLGWKDGRFNHAFSRTSAVKYVMITDKLWKENSEIAFNLEYMYSSTINKDDDKLLFVYVPYDSKYEKERYAAKMINFDMNCSLLGKIKRRFE